jgi:hypothetical protein
MAHHRFGDLAADRVDWVERRHRLLEHHGNGRAAHRRQLPLAERRDVVLADLNAAPDDGALARQETHEGAHRDRLAAAGFADDA